MDKLSTMIEDIEISERSYQAAKGYLEEKQLEREEKQLMVTIIIASCFAAGILIGMII